MTERTRYQDAGTNSEFETAEDVKRRVDVADISELANIETQEREGPNRKGVMTAIQVRRDQLTSTGTDQPEAAVYTLQELMDGSEPAFGVTPEVVAGAMRLAGVTYATKEATQQFIDAFLARPV